MSEATLLECVLDAAARFGWLRCHIRPARTMVNGVETWRTPYQGDEGLTDLILARGGIVLLAELKSMAGKVTEGQKAWLIAAHGDRWEDWVWRPEQWFDGTVEDILR